MRSRLRAHLTYANLISTLCLVLIVGGGAAYAADTIFSSDIVNGEVKSVDIGTDEVTTADLATGGVRTIDILDGTVDGVDLANGAVANAKLATDAVNSAKVDNNSITSGDVRTDTLTGGDLGSGSVGSDEIADQTVAGFDIGNNQIDGNHIVDESLSAGDTSDVFDAGYASDTACDDDDQDGEACASMTLELHERGVLLVNATGEWENAGSGGNGVEMSCVLQVDGLDIGIAQSIGEAGDNHPTAENGTMALTALSPQLETGSHTVQTFCTEFNADIDLEDNQITAARVDL